MAGETDTNIPPVNQDEQFQQIKSMFDQIAGQGHGLFGRTVINPDAAKMLPQSEGAKILAMGKSGMALLGGTAPEFPFAAWAQQHQPPPPPSYNTKLMEAAAEKMKQPVTDARWSQNLTNRFQGVFNKYQDEYGPQQFAEMIETGMDRRGGHDAAKVHYDMQTLNNAAEMNTKLGKDFDKVRDDVSQKGLVPDPEFGQMSARILDHMGDMGGSNEDWIKKASDLDNNLEAYKGVSELAEQYLPSDKLLNKTIYKVPATDGDGKPIKGAFEYYTVANDATGKPSIDPTTGKPKLEVDANGKSTFDQELTERAKALQEDYKGSYPTKMMDIDYLKQRMGFKLPHPVEYHLEREPKPNVTNVNTGAVQTNTAFKAAGEGTTFGSGDKAITQDAQSSYNLTPFKVNLGTQNNVISQNTGESGSVDLNNAEVGNIQNRRVKVVNGKIQVTNETGENTFIAPMAVASKPKFEYQEKVDPITKQAVIDPSTGKPEVTKVQTDITENYYVPLSYVANSNSNDKNAVLIKDMYKDALDANKSDANEDARKEFQKYFGMEEIDISKNKKTGAKSTNTTTTNPAAIY